MSLKTTVGVLLRRTDYRDADLIVSLFTPDLGKISALARGARRSQRRFGGSLEPMHRLRLELSGPPQRYVLEAATIDAFRDRLTRNLNHLNVAARALAWVRDGVPDAQPESDVWDCLEVLLDALDAPVERPNAVLAGTGLRLLDALGWGLEFDRCVTCGRECPAGKAAHLDAARGGLVCSSCGGARLTLSGEQRQSLTLLRQDLNAPVDEETALLGLRLVEQALSTHADIHR